MQIFFKTFNDSAKWEMFHALAVARNTKNC